MIRLTKNKIIISGAVVILLTSLSGKLVMWGALGNFLQKNLKFLITFALGVFSVTLYLVFGEARELQDSITSIALAAAFGALILEVIHHIIPESHHHHGADESECCDHEHQDAAKQSNINPLRVLIGDALHNIGDGIILVPAFLLSTSAGLTLAVGIIIHEFVQETSEFFILKEAGYSTKKALIANLIAQSTIFIGIFISIFTVNAGDYQAILVSMAMGALAYIIFRDLLPHTLERVRHGGKPFIHMAMFLVGVVIMITLASVLPG